MNECGCGPVKLYEDRPMGCGLLTSDLGQALFSLICESGSQSGNILSLVGCLVTSGDFFFVCLSLLEKRLAACG